MESVYFNEEHKLFRKSVRAFVERELRPQADDWERAGIFPKEIFRKLGDLGYLGIRFDEKYGGLGLDYWYTLILCEELVRSLSVGMAAGVLVHGEFATSAIHDEGSEELKREILPAAIRGEVILALGVTEPGGGSNVTDIRTTAKKDKGDFVINGSKTFITNGTRADYVTLAVRTGGPGAGGISLIAFPTDTKGFSIGKSLNKMGLHASDTAELFFSDCRVPARYLIGEENKGFWYILKHFQGERLVLACFANGIMQLLWEEALKYGAEREVFGKAIIKHQVWRHRLADVLTSIEASRQLAYWACDRLNKTGDAHQEVSMAKLFASQTLKRVADEVLQLHGGYGYVEEYSVCRLYRDAAAFTIGAGTSEIMREIIAEKSLPADS